MNAGTRIDELLGLMRTLRTPDIGCPWDQVQTFATIAPYTIEEAYEVADAIERRDFEDLRDELGDLLLQVVFHSRIAEEHGLFRFEDVVEAISAKLVRRHPHVFGDRRGLDAAAVKELWEEIKGQEAAQKVARGSPSGHLDASALDGVPLALPALTRAEKLGRRAAASGFDWGAPADVLAKIREEIGEVEDALAHKEHEDVREEIGDLLLAVTNLARFVGIDAEASLRAANAKFSNRFRSMERTAATQGRSLAELDAAALDELWRESKRLEGTGASTDQV